MIHKFGNQFVSWFLLYKLLPIATKINPLEHHSGGTVGQTWENCIWLCLFFCHFPQTLNVQLPLSLRMTTGSCL
jgi:hypothetical protein